jgi:hypothetical protein
MLMLIVPRSTVNRTCQKRAAIVSVKAVVTAAAVVAARLPTRAFRFLHPKRPRTYSFGA